MRIHGVIVLFAIPLAAVLLFGVAESMDRSPTLDTTRTGSIR